MYQLIKQSFHFFFVLFFLVLFSVRQTRRLCCTFGYPLTDVVSILSFKIPIFFVCVCIYLLSGLTLHLTLLYARFYRFGIL